MFACAGQAKDPGEYELKAVLLFNLARFVDWPPSAFNKPDEPIIIGVLGHDPFGRALDEVVRGETINGHPVYAERYQSVKAAMRCQILFLSSSEQGRLRHDLAATQARPILTVGEQEGFLREGGIIRLYVNSEQKVRLQLNIEAAKTHSITISSKLLRVAEVPRED